MLVKSRIAEPVTGKSGSARQGPRPEWVEAAPFRAHVRFLMAEADVPGEVVAALAEVRPRVVRRLLTGAGERPMRRLNPVVASQLYALTPGLLRQSQIAEVPAAPVGVALQRLLGCGWSLDSLACLLRTEVSTVTDLLHGHLRVCPKLLAVRAAAVPVPTTARRASATPMVHAA